jgi:hypothetical protein
MKRFLSFTLFGIGAVLLGGCPIYPDTASDYRVCDSYGCHSCPSDNYSDDCTPWQCGGAYDCPSGFDCNGYGTCVPYADAGPAPTTCTKPSDCGAGMNCGRDGTCHIGDCTNSGCASGYVCKLANGTVQCVASSIPDAGPPKDGGVFSGCTSDKQCASTPGARCLDGTCTAPANQCSDTGQCRANEQCVQGACTPSCATTSDCPTGYSCDAAKKVCTGNPTPCNDAPTSCAPGTTCAQDHCVTPCGPGGTCQGDNVCVQGGCVPNQKPTFTCTTDGVQDTCAVGSVCLHHSCYIGCSPDAGVEACKNADKFNECKSVESSSKTFYVCGSSTSLGTQCDPAQGKGCDGGICIDGFCR